MVEEIVVHEVPVALVMLMGQAHVLVHIEGDDVGKRELPGLIHAHELLVHADGAGAGGQAQHEGAVFLVGADLRSDVVGSPLAHFIVIILNNNSHVDSPYCHSV